ncbi:MAG TPA: hypothetical protein VL588_04615 [Bdellovibrionota bacterium]|nr:hypothetical protein [Bdellovibrionota bacterium]
MTPLLFIYMAGLWTADGARTSLVSGKVVQIHAETEARVESAADGTSYLVSHNRLTETLATNDAHTYERVFWLRAKDSGAYDLGYGDPTDASSTNPQTLAAAGLGAFTADTNSTPHFDVSQPLSPDGSLRVDSVSRFTDESTVEYDERLLQNGHPVSETHLTYKKVWLPQDAPQQP